MKKLALVAVLVGAVVTGCKKKEDAAPAAGSGSAPAMAMGSGSGSAPSMAAGSGSAPAMAGSGSAMGSGSAGSGSSAMAGSGSAMGSAGSGSGAAHADAKNWDCKKLCTEAVKCKDKDFKSEKECEDDCTKVMHDTTGKYTNGSIQGVPFYSCANTAKDCAAEKKCHPGAK
jgi:hypothetical protein